MNVIEGRFDRRAKHRIFSEPVAIEGVMDLTARAMRGVDVMEALHWIALGTGDADLVKGIGMAHAEFAAMRDELRRYAGLIEDSVPVDPYTAVAVAGLEAA